MRRFGATLSIGIANAKQRETFEFEDDTPDEEIEETIRMWAMELVEWGYSEDEA